MYQGLTQYIPGVYMDVPGPSMNGPGTYRSIHGCTRYIGNYRVYGNGLQSQVTAHEHTDHSLHCDDTQGYSNSLHSHVDLMMSDHYFLL